MRAARASASLRPHSWGKSHQTSARVSGTDGVRGWAGCEPSPVQQRFWREQGPAPVSALSLSSLGPLELLGCSPPNFPDPPPQSGCAGFAMQVQALYPKFSPHSSLPVLLHMPPEPQDMWATAWIGCWSLFNDTPALLLIKIS